MVRGSGSGLAAAAVAIVLAPPAPAFAQRTAENAVTASEDAFGTQVGLESTGIYTEGDTRGLVRFTITLLFL